MPYIALQRHISSRDWRKPCNPKDSWFPNWIGCLKNMRLEYRDVRWTYTYFGSGKCFSVFTTHVICVCCVTNRRLNCRRTSVTMVTKLKQRPYYRILRVSSWGGMIFLFRMVSRPAFACTQRSPQRVSRPVSPRYRMGHGANRRLPVILRLRIREAIYPLSHKPSCREKYLIMGAILDLYLHAKWPASIKFLIVM
jgi:hypothetical protein